MYIIPRIPTHHYQWTYCFQKTMLYLILVVPILTLINTSYSQLVVPQGSPRSASESTTQLNAPLTLGLRCLQTLTRFERPRTESCAKALLQMPSDATQQIFRHGGLLPYVKEADGCTLRVHAPEASQAAHTSWLYLQTAATQLMTGCLRVYDQSAIRTGGVIRVGRMGAFLEISLSKGPDRILSEVPSNTTVADTEFNSRQER